jgi:hypothetical protein
VTVDLDRLLGRPDSLGGEGGWAGPLDPTACQRLACDGAVTRVLVTRHPSHRHPSHHPPNHDTHHDEAAAAQDPDADHRTPARDPGGLEGRLRAAGARLPPILGGAPTQPLEVGRTTRVIHPAQRTALAVRDGGCVFPGCSRPWPGAKPTICATGCKAAPTTLPYLALVCRTHHRAVHAGGWQLIRQADGRLTATPPHRPHRSHRRHPTAA